MYRIEQPLYLSSATLFESLNANYTISNAFDRLPGHLWISKSCFDTISIFLDAGAGGLFITNCEADWVNYRILRNLETKSITSISLNPFIATTSIAHGFSIDQAIWIKEVIGSVEVNERVFWIASIPESNKFTLKDADGNMVSGLGFGTYLSGGTVTPVSDFGLIEFRLIMDLQAFFLDKYREARSSWREFPYQSDLCLLELDVFCVTNRKGTITNWNSPTAGITGRFTNGSSPISLENKSGDTLIQIGSLVTFESKTWTLSSVSHAPGQNIEITLTTSHLLMAGDLVKISNTGNENIDHRVFLVDSLGITSTKFKIKRNSILGTESYNFPTSISVGKIEKLYSITDYLGDGSAVDSITLTPNPASATETVTSVIKSARLGEVDAGFVKKYPNAQIGLKEKRIDYSKIKINDNGELNFKNRNIAKVFDANILLDAGDKDEFMSFYEKQRAEPFSCLFVNGMNQESQTAIFCIMRSVGADWIHKTANLFSNSFEVLEIM